MSPQSTFAPALTSAELLDRHDLTRRVAAVCRQELRTCLDALAQLFRPRRVLGDFVEGSGREGVPDAAENFARLQDMFSSVCGRPFELRRELASPLEAPPTQMQVYDWEYVHRARNDRETRTMVVTAPLTWVVMYPSVYSLSMMRQVTAGKQERNYEAVHAFVLRACMFSLLLERDTRLVWVLEGLRYHVEFRKLPELGELPLVTLSAPVRTYRPSDELLLTATGLSGRAMFQEVLDLESANQIRDPVRERITAILREHTAGGPREE
jgi:hypothetical protein